MTLLLVFAASLLVLSASLLFGPQLVAYGPSALRDLARRSEARMVSLVLTGAFGLLLFAPGAASSLISGDETVQLVASTHSGPAAA